MEKHQAQIGRRCMYLGRSKTGLVCGCGAEAHSNGLAEMAERLTESNPAAHSVTRGVETLVASPSATKLGLDRNFLEKGPCRTKTSSRQWCI